MLEKILIADGSDLALRIARTCERLGIETAAVHAEGDASALHVNACDKALPLAGYDASHIEDHLEGLIAVAQANNAKAIHPGSIRLGANSRLAQAVEQAGLIWIGTPSTALAALTDPFGFRTRVTDAGLRSPPGSDAPVESLEVAREQAAGLEYPLRVLPLVEGIAPTCAERPAELEQCVAASLAAMGRSGSPPRIRLEVALDQPRRIMVPVLVDSTRETAALAEREWTLEHGQHVLIEESPAPGLRALHDAEHKRRILLDGAARIARDAGIVGSAGVSFAIDALGRLYVTGISPGLLGAVGATEMCTGNDLSEAEIRIAQGEHIARDLRSRPGSGHAIEARVYSETTPHNPSLGPKPDAIRTLRFPPIVPGAMRIEPALAANTSFAPEDEVLIAKVIAFGQTRHQAWLTLDRVLAETTIEPVMSNLRLLRDILADEAFRAGQYDIGSVERIIALIKAPPQ